MRRPELATAALLWPLLAGCPEKEATEIMLTVDSDLTVSLDPAVAELDTIRIRVLRFEPDGVDGGTPVTAPPGQPPPLDTPEGAVVALDGRLYTHRWVADFPMTAGSLPLEIGVAPEGRDAGRIVYFEAFALLDGEIVARVAARTGFVRSKTLRLVLWLTAACKDVVCPPDFTCVEGDCVSVDREAECLPSADHDAGAGRGLPVCDAGVPPGTDGGPRPDGGPTDAGPSCTPGTVARDCGPYPPVLCTDAFAEPPPCPTSCGVDEECLSTAHCESGACVLDRPPGDPCLREGECAAGLACADGVCCDTPCAGLCESCALAGAPGTCTPVPRGMDPGGDCAGFSCAEWYVGFDATSGDACYTRAAVDDVTATCDGGGACLGPADLCPAQPADTRQIDCDDTCQAPAAGTCRDTTAGRCDNLSLGNQSCGTGACMVTVPVCSGGMPVTCVAGMASTDICNGIDDDCDGTVDNNPASILCPPPPNVTGTSCVSASCRIASCAARWYDIDGSYGNGCECQDDTASSACASATNLGSIAPGASATAGPNRTPIGGTSDWFRADFPAASRPGAGTPTVELTAGTDPSYRFEVRYACGSSAAACGSGGGAVDRTSWSFVDNADVSGTYRTNGTPWPSTVFIRVYRSGGNSCVSYNLRVRR